jgi:xylulokinase
MRPGGAPYYDLNARGAFIGLSLTSSKADLLRASMEGIALNVRAMLQHLEGDRAFDKIRIIGGGAKSKLWRQIFANVLKKEVLRLSAQQEANTLGAALVGGVATGAFENFSVVDKYAAIEEVTSFDAEASAVYDELFHVFGEAYRGLKQANELLSRTRASQQSHATSQGEKN